ncbi:MAG: hypothetical protein ACO3MW_11880 [Rhodospirillales bacterium]
METEKTEYNFLSLGAGVQSTCLALMCKHGEIEPMPDAAIFADTKAEPDEVYEHLDWLESVLPFPVYRVSAGSLTEMITRPQLNKKGEYNIRNQIPAWIETEGQSGITLRSCTTDFKIRPLLKKQRELAKIKRGQKHATCTSYIGISLDEIQRMKESRDKWCINRWPLVEARMTRHDCKLWLERNGYPEPPRSACVYCPFHSNSEWQRLKTNDPKSFAEAVRVEKEMQNLNTAAKNSGSKGFLRQTPYLHKSCKPIDQVDFEADKNQMDLFQNECDGMCGV